MSPSHHPPSTLTSDRRLLPQTPSFTITITPQQRHANHRAPDSSGERPPPYGITEGPKPPALTQHRRTRGRGRAIRARSPTRVAFSCTPSPRLSAAVRIPRHQPRRPPATARHRVWRVTRPSLLVPDCHDHRHDDRHAYDRLPR